MLARFFKGGITFHDMYEMKFRTEIKPIYDIYVLQSTEEEVVYELSYDENGKKKQLPSTQKVRKIVLDRIAERKKKDEQWQEADFQLKP